MSAPPRFPAELRALKGWVLWKLVHKKGKPKPLKMPYYVNGSVREGEQGGKADRALWASYDDAARVLADRIDEFDGLGLVMSPDWGIVGLDFDHCVDESGVVLPAVEDVIGDTYAEYSPSGTGVHAFMRGTLPRDRKSSWEKWGWGFETFCNTGFLTMTGRPTPVCELVGNTGLDHLNGSVHALLEARFPNGSHEATEAVEVPPRGMGKADVRALLWRCTPDGSYLDWFKRGGALNHESSGAQWGLDLWIEHSLTGTADVATADEMTDKWGTMKRTKGATTIAYLESIAGADLTAFDVIVEAPRSPNEPPTLPKFEMGIGRDKGRVLATLDNVIMALERPDLCGVRIAYDEFRHVVMVCWAGAGVWKPIQDDDRVQMRRALERAPRMRFKPVTKDIARDAAMRVALQNRFDSAQDWLGTLTWDGVGRVDRFLETYLGCAGGEYGRAVSRYIWTAMPGRVMAPGIQAEMVPVFQGAQSIGKTQSVKAMVPSTDLYVEINLKGDETDTIRLMRGKLIGEMGELRGLRTRDIESIRAFVTRQEEKWIEKWDIDETTYKRRLIFIGTTNPHEILADPEGERRWLPIHVERADVEAIRRDRDQLWAEGAVLFLSEGVAWQDAERLAKAEHAAFKVSDAWEESISNWLDGYDELPDVDGVGARGSTPFTTTEVLGGALQLAPKDRNRGHSDRAVAVLKGLGYRSVIKWINGRSTRVWIRANT